MEALHPEGLKPRKTPRQARSEATVQAIFEATIQVLLSEGASRLTTTRVAERAGVSVGTMYQYFPHKQALLYAVLSKHLEAVASAVEAACLKYRETPAATMASGLVTAYVDAKTAHADLSHALYLIAGELDTADLVGGVTQRLQDAMAKLLASAVDAEFDDLPSITFALGAAMAGMTRAVFERGAPPPLLRVLRTQLATMCVAYLQAMAVEKVPPRRRAR
ncbi:TetR/AcrR family transcriptional regulator [Cupriavidus lacunae]|uniref:TetR/AcrR family transcriptional regulator n=1 Tax=Cupriavidus lacunae TaxID=2666307 RepID=A0A370NRF8_9BURK|nr:TetR/AcrR family transcriptional regulator [Cupriavidus lacunae]RDK08118.1 TetR/AcrR family transcriptional regulator [Cupriavidus lacunae]